MRDKFRKSANTLVSTKPSERSDRGRPREREHRKPLGAQKERSRDRDFIKPIKHKSRSPVRSSKILPLLSANTSSISRNIENVDRVNRNRKIERNLDSGRDSGNRDGGGGSRGGGSRGERKRVYDDEDEDERVRGQRSRSDRESLLKGKLRMDRGSGSGGDREREPLSRNKPPNSSNVGGSSIISRFQELASGSARSTGDLHLRKQPPGELDRVVQRAKEERSSYWNKRVIEAEEKDPNRGHSGFKELYRRDMKSPQDHHSRARSSSLTNNNSKHFRGSPGPRHREHIPPRRSRSRSPRNKSFNSRNDLRRSITPPKQQRNSNNSNFVPLGPRPTGSGSSMRRISPLLSRVIPERKSDRDERSRDYGSSRVGKSSRNSNSMGKGDSAGRRAPLMNEKSFGSRSSGGSRNMEENKSANDSYRRTDRERERHSDKRDNNTRFHDSSSVSMSRSRSRSTSSPPPRSSGNTRGSKGDQKQMKDSRNRNAAKPAAKVATLGSRGSRSKSSSSSSSSEDGDVLQLHADDRRKGRGASSISRSSSSSSDSKSSTSSQNSSSKRKAASDSSSSSSSDSDSDDDSDVSGKISMEKTKKSSTTESNKTKETAESGTYKSKSSSELKSSESRAGTKRPSSAPTSTAASKAARPSSSKSSTSKNSREKEKTTTTTTTRSGSKGESDSESGSSSDSADSEPRMTLSERFAKLTQMSTDKREFAKPLLSVNEIDTKLKVVKDLRNADMKIYMDGPHGLQQQQRSGGSSSSSVKPRPKSPEYAYAEGEKRYTTDERRLHFERMAEDEPRERPADWSDSRVRFEYYRDRGYFNDRPISFEEYVKWEEWWYQYRDWLQHEGYYPPPTRVPAGAVPRSGNFSGPGEGSRGQSRNGDWNQPPAGMSPRLRMRPIDMPSPPGRRVEQIPGRLVPLSSRPHFIGRPEDRGGGGMGRLGPDSRSSIMGGRGGGVPRAIGRAPGGSLIVTTGNYGPRGRQVGLLRGRNR